MKDDRGRALDFEQIRRRKLAKRRRKIALIIAAGLLALAVVVTVVVLQVAQVTDGSRGFWENFSASHSTGTERATQNEG